MFSLWRSKRPLIIAHRGARGLVPFENTVEAFEEAVRLGAPMMEFDLRRLGDGTIVCFHDEDIDGVPISELTLENLRERTRQIGYEVPTLEDLLKRFRKRIRFDIELKETGYEAEILDLVLEHLDYDDFVCKSFYDEAVLALKEHDLKAKAGLLLGVDGPMLSSQRWSEFFPNERLEACKADFVSPNVALVRGGFVLRMRQLGMPVYVWTVNDRATMKMLLRKGVDAIITDRPDIGLSLLRK